MNARLNYMLIPLLVLILAGAYAGWWFNVMEQRWSPNYVQSDASTKNSMLGAQRLLSQHQYTVQIEDILSAYLLKRAMPRGTVILSQNIGVMTRPQVNQLLAWVADGNNLILQPSWGNLALGGRRPNDGAVTGGNSVGKNKAQARFDDDARDDIGSRFGVGLEPAAGESEVCRSAAESEAEQKKRFAGNITLIECTANITIPDKTYALHLGPSYQQLTALGSTRRMQFYDQEGKAVRSFDYGKGHVTFIAQNYFDNPTLPEYDHAELLLALVDLNQDARHVTIIKHLDSPAWYRLLWVMFPQTLLALGVALILLGWVAVRRFGPLLPEPDLTRRSMVEHVEASSRWLWKSGKGREILLDAARAATLKVLLRRVPQLHGTHEQEKTALLAQQTSLVQSDIDAALHNIAASRPQEFTRQIQTLQRLRKHYER